MAKQIVILGSSGGNLYHLGGKDPENLLGELVRQIRAAGMEISAIQFIAASASMDRIKPEEHAGLWTWNGSEPALIFQGTLAEVNKKAAEEDAAIAEKIAAGQVDGAILVSADPKGANAKAFAAAAQKKLTAVGTGGTSMAQAEAMGLHVAAVSGTTGTTNRTRAIANVFALAKEWNLSYHPAIGKGDTAHMKEGSLLSRISLHGVLMASLPGFIAMALTLIISKIPGLGYFETIFNTMIDALPVIVATVACHQISGLGDVAIVAGVVTGILSVKGGLIGGMIGGILAGALVEYLLIRCLKLNFPATTANIVAGGIAGLIAGLIVYLFIAPFAAFVGDGIRGLIDAALAMSSILCGVIAGLLIWPAIMCGMYHAAILPIIMLEMEKTGSSFLGAIDMVGLVMVSAGITLANVVSPRRKDDRALAVPGLFINLVFGTFVEAAYPFMFSDKMVMIGAILSAGVGGFFVGYFNVHGTAYVPCLAAPALSNNWLGFIISMAASAFCAFCITVAANKFHAGKNVSGGE